jgi:DNA replication protein DnaC
MTQQSGNTNDIDYLTNEKTKIIDACPKCHGLDLSCTCYHEYDVEVRKIRANIPMKYRKANLAAITSPQAEKPKAQLQSYITSMKKKRKAGTGLYLWGNEGTAKTYLGCAVLIEALKIGYSAYFTTLNDCMDNIIHHREAFAYVLQNATYLMIDDMGYAYRPIRDEIAYVDSVLDKVVRTRCNELQPNILTSHKNIAQMALANPSGARIASIIKEHMLRVQFTGENFRDSIKL